ncbi:hypothetical protein INR49_004559 [Caranx melampygus]|nr:hypothetical protein INR49_004559 [Caranx melampygus]
MCRHHRVCQRYAGQRGVSWWCRGRRRGWWCLWRETNEADVQMEDKNGAEEPAVTATVGENVTWSSCPRGFGGVRFALGAFRPGGPGLAERHCHDFSAKAAALIARNAEYNGVAICCRPAAGTPVYADVQMRGKKERYDVIDLDPYGSPASFLDAAVCCV